MNTETGSSALLVPELVLNGLRMLNEKAPQVAAKLSFYYLDLLTKPLRDRIQSLEDELSREREQPNA